MQVNPDLAGLNGRDGPRFQTMDAKLSLASVSIVVDQAGSPRSLS